MGEDVLLPLPLGVSDFHKLRESGKIYVDKTGLIYQLAATYEKLFLARPRRFGKSLLVSTFESLFKYGLRDFKGLAIEKLWKEDKTYNVVRLDFSRIKNFSTIEQFEECLDHYLIDLMIQENMRSSVPASLEGLRGFRKLCKIRNFSQSPFGGFISEESDGNFPSGRN